MNESYRTLVGPSEGYLKEKGSRFLAFAFPVNDLEEVEAELDGVRKKYHDARHVCYAYRLGREGKTMRANDDGEPSHSAGDPILNEIRSQELTFVLVAVVRYFGGTKLGVSGLIEAYKLSTRDALSQGKIKEIWITETISIRFPYELTSEVNRITHHLDIQPKDSAYGADCRHIYEVREKQAPEVRSQFEKLGILETTDDTDT